MKADVTTLDAQKAGTVDLDDAIYGLAPRADILHRMVHYQLAKRQMGTHKTKIRSEITGTTKKFVRQKGTGSARHSTRKANLFVGGGRAHGPKPRSHAVGLPKKFRAFALKTALSAKAKAQQLIILDKAESKDGKTNILRQQLDKLGVQSALIIDGAQLDEKFVRAAHNIARIDVLPVQGINVYDILRRDYLLLTKSALTSLEARFN